MARATQRKAQGAAGQRDPRLQRRVEGRALVWLEDMEDMHILACRLQGCNRRHIKLVDSRALGLQRVFE